MLKIDIPYLHYFFLLTDKKEKKSKDAYGVL